MSEKTESGDDFDMAQYKRELDETIEGVMPMSWEGHFRLEQDDYQSNTVGGFRFGSK